MGQRKDKSGASHVVANQADTQQVHNFRVGHLARTLPFFPASLPDETLHSRVSRFHQLSANLSEEQTFSQLFAQKPLDLGLPVSPLLEVLAARLPGELDEQQQLIREQNTLLPLFRPFLPHANKDPAACSFKLHATLCLSCIHEDEEEHGVAYWHRSHQAPMVTVCWKHDELTLNRCPFCGHRFQKGSELLGIPWSCLKCKKSLRNAKGVPVRHDVASRYAKFTYAVLNACISEIDPESLRSMYCDRIKQRGFTFGGAGINLAQFAKSMVDDLGKDLVAGIDPIFSLKESVAWLRQCTRECASDVPLSRHLLLAMYLFETVDEFMIARLNCVSLDAALRLELQSDRYASVKNWIDQGGKTRSQRLEHPRNLPGNSNNDKRVVPPNHRRSVSYKFGLFSTIWQPKWAGFFPDQARAVNGRRRNKRT
jgi:hypothetical protein